MKSNRLVSAVLLLSAVWSCQTPPQEEEPEVVPDIQIPAASQAIFDAGITFSDGAMEQSAAVKFKATASWRASIEEDGPIVWLSARPDHGDAGEVEMTLTAKPNPFEEQRSATVSITCGQVVKSFQVRQPGTPPVIVPVEKVTLSQREINMEVGHFETLTATVTPKDATDRTVTWSSSNPEVASVEGGLVLAVNGGNATITATAGGVSASCAVTVTVPVSGIVLDHNTLELDEGQTALLTATVSPSDASAPEVTWSSSDSEVASVEGGLVTALKAGSAIITAVSGEKSASCRVTVTYFFSVSPQSIIANPDGGEFTITVVCTGTYVIQSMPHWITEKSAREKVHTFTVADNPAADARSGEIVFADAKGTVLSVSVSQDGHLPDPPQGGNEDVEEGEGIQW